MFTRVDIHQKLLKLRDRSIGEREILAQVNDILKDHQTTEEKILTTLSHEQSTAGNGLDLDLLETDRVYHISHIKKICIDYRLRFLDTKYFKGTYPKEALEAVKALEEEHRTQLRGFQIVAPSKLFRLENADDPLLFVPLGNDYFYLVHKWGNDLHPLRKWLLLPFKNLGNLTLLIVLLSLLLTAMVPSGLFSKESGSLEFWMIFFFMFKSVAAVVIFYGFALGKNFNHAIWNSKYFNA